MEEVLIQTDSVSVRILELEVGEALPWHHHSEVTDHIFALDGEIEVQFGSPDEKVALGIPGMEFRGHNTGWFLTPRQTA